MTRRKTFNSRTSAPHKHSTLNVEGRVRGGVCVLLLVLGMLNVGRAATPDAFEQGVALSNAGQFPEAAAAFEKSAKERPASGTLLDLGLAEWQRGHAGAAIVAWEQAHWLDPFDTRAEANLKFARQASQVDEPELKWHEAVSMWLPADDWAWLACFTFWLAVGLLVLPGIFRRRKTGWQQWLAALSFGVFLLSVTASYGVTSRTHIGFVVKKNASLQLTPTQHGEVVSALAAGEPARQVRTRGNFVFIRTLSTVGWVAKDDFRLVCPR